jgi:type IV pilus assembly protein PilE
MAHPKRFLIRGSSGFTLIELMITVVIAATLVAIALPAYRSYVLRSHRTEAKTILLDLAGREERFYNMNIATGYTATAANLGYNSAFPANTSDGYYQITVCVPASACGDTVATAAAPLSYAITATAIGTQVNDTACTLFMSDNLGLQSAKNSVGAVTTACW